MKSYLIRNLGADNLRAEITVTPNNELGYDGTDGATMVAEDSITTCLIPQVSQVPIQTDNTSEEFTLDANSQYVVEVNGEVIPFILTAEELPMYFNGIRHPLVMFVDAANNVISCEGARDVFYATTSAETNNIEISINDGPWTNILMNDSQDVGTSVQPGNPGILISLMFTGLQPARVRMRASRPIGLYVNQTMGVNQVRDNAAYTLYDSLGNVIDPLNMDNFDYSGTEFGDSSTELDYAVFFSSVDLCLDVTKDRSFVEFAGATGTVFDMVMDGTTYTNTNASPLKAFIDGLELGFDMQESTIPGDRTSNRFALTPLFFPGSTMDIKLIARGSLNNFTESLNNSNDTLVIDELTKTISFILES